MTTYREPGVRVTIQEENTSTVPPASKLAPAIIGPGFQVLDGELAGVYDGTSATYSYPDLMSGTIVDTASIVVEIANTVDGVTYIIDSSWYTPGLTDITLLADIYQVISSGTDGETSNGSADFIPDGTVDLSSTTLYSSDKLVITAPGGAAGTYDIAGYDSTTGYVVLQDPFVGNYTGVEWEIQRPIAGNVLISLSALRTDLVASRVYFETQADVIDEAGGTQAIIPTNPLFYGCYIATGQQSGVWGVGVQDMYGSINPDLLDTTAWTAAFTYCMQYTDMYAYAILCQANSLIPHAQTFVDWVSLPDNRAESVVFLCPERTIEEVAIDWGTLVGAFSDSGADVIFQGNPLYDFEVAGCTPMGYIEYIYIDPVTLEETTFSVRVRKVDTTTLTVLDPTDIPTAHKGTDWTYRYVNDYYTNAEEAAFYKAFGESFEDKRMRLLFPDTLGVEISGTTTAVPGYYWWCERVGLIGANENPATPYTRKHSSFFARSYLPFRSRALLNVIASGGWEIAMQDSVNLPPYCRHQLTTDMTHPARAEQSVVHSVDHCAKYVREIMDNNIGTCLGSSALLTQFKTLLSGVGVYLVSKLQSLASLRITHLDFSETDPRDVDVTLRVGARYPVNNIDILLIVS